MCFRSDATDWKLLTGFAGFAHLTPPLAVHSVGSNRPLKIMSLKGNDTLKRMKSQHVKGAQESPMWRGGGDINILLTSHSYTLTWQAAWRGPDALWDSRDKGAPPTDQSREEVEEDGEEEKEEERVERGQRGAPEGAGPAQTRPGGSFNSSNTS